MNKLDRVTSYLLILMSGYLLGVLAYVLWRLL